MRRSWYSGAFLVYGVLCLLLGLAFGVFVRAVGAPYVWMIGFVVAGCGGWVIKAGLRPPEESGGLH